MKSLRILSLSLAFAAVPVFAGLNYNASKSNTGNIALVGKGGKQAPNKSKTIGSSGSSTAKSRPSPRQ